MRELTNRERKLLKAALILSVVISAYLGIKGLFIDLYNPGSPVARQYSDWVNRIFIVTILISLPLLIEKYNKATTWLDGVESMEPKEVSGALWKATKPILTQAFVVVIIAIIASVIIAWYWHIPPDVALRYQNYYSNNTSLSITKDINNSIMNNITINLTKP